MKIQKKDIPNILTISRFFFVPFSLYFLYKFESPYPYVIFMLLAQVPDILDGYLARKWNVATDFGRILDSYSDYYYQGFLIWGIFHYLGRDLLSEHLLSSIILSTILVPFLYTLLRRGKCPQLHLNTNRLCWAVTAMFFVYSLFIEFNSFFYLIVTIFFVIAGIDRLLYYIIYEKDEELIFPTSYHLWRAKK